MRVRRIGSNLCTDSILSYTLLICIFFVGFVDYISVCCLNVFIVTCVYVREMSMYCQIVYQVIEDVAVASILRDDVDHGLRLHDLVEPDDGRVEQVPHDLDLPRDLPQVVRVQVALVHDLDGHLGPGEPVGP